MKIQLYSTFLTALMACSTINSQEPVTKPSQEFNDYWYAGKAEITSYELQQARYGEVHAGTAALIFVTEPFSKNKQVKLDDWRNEGEDNVSVMKLNMTKKFLTGIYPYSMMMSTFTPVSYNRYPNPFKVTTSSQEWCGHTFMQLNLRDKGYDLKGFSYFESEGDVEATISRIVLEDELWTRIRFNPELLPIGQVDLLPSTFYLRMRHQEANAVKANVSLMSVPSSEFSPDVHSKYSIKYTNRSLDIYFESAFPYAILGWEETYLSGFGKPELLTTKAKRIESIQSAYWGKNTNMDRELRKDLGLSNE